MVSNGTWPNESAAVATSRFSNVSISLMVLTDTCLCTVATTTTTTTTTTHAPTTTTAPVPTPCSGQSIFRITADPDLSGHFEAYNNNLSLVLEPSYTLAGLIGTDLLNLTTHNYTFDLQVHAQPGFYFGFAASGTIANNPAVLVYLLAGETVLVLNSPGGNFTSVAVPVDLTGNAKSLLTLSWCAATQTATFSLNGNDIATTFSTGAWPLESAVAAVFNGAAANITYMDLSSLCQCTQCRPYPCFVLGLNCGSVQNGCGGVQDCGQCTPPQTCGGAGTPNVCGVIGCCVGPGGEPICVDNIPEADCASNTFLPMPSVAHYPRVRAYSTYT